MTAVPSAAACLAALHGAAAPLAWADAHGRLAWVNAAFAGLLEPPLAADQDLAQRLGPQAWAALRQHGAWVADADGANAAPWRWRAQAQADGSWTLSAEPRDAELAQARRAQRLAERLDLVQRFTHTGIFERDPTTMQGTWDAQMFEIWGLAAPAGGGAAPASGELDPMVLDNEVQHRRLLGSHAAPGEYAARLRVRRPDGQLRHVHSQWRVEHDATGHACRILGVNTDDTAVYELASRAQRLRSELDAALALSRIGVWRHEFATGRVLFDQRHCDIVGIAHPPQGLTLEQTRALIHPDDRERAERSAARTLADGQPSDMELRYPQRDGSTRHVLSRRVLQRDDEGRPIGFLGVTLDITETIEQRRQATESARRLEAAAAAARIGLWSADPSQPLPHWNPLMAELLGLPAEQAPLPMRDWLQRCVHPDDRQRVHDQMRAWWHGPSGETEIGFRVVRPRDGALRWLVLRGHVRSAHDGAAPAAEGVMIDITEHRLTLQRLTDTVERMAIAARAVGLGAWESTDTDTQLHWDAQMFRLRGVNGPARRVTLDEAAAFVHPDDRAVVAQAQAAALREGTPWRQEYRVCWPDGSVRWISSHSVPVFDDQGHQRRCLGLNWDCTEAHEAAQAVRERERAIAESQAKSRWMSRISHELRTPLNAVLGFTQLARRDLTAERPQRDRWLALAEDSGRHLLALINDVLEISSATTGEMRLALQPVDVAEAVRTAIQVVEPQARLSHVPLRTGALAVPSVQADPVRLRQVLLNLLSNAIKYNRPGGWVEVSAATVAAGVALRVADTGKGIAAQRLPDAFEVFNRLGAEDTAVPGTGVGLAVVKLLVERMGGQVTATSEPGRGSVFTVTLPAADVQPQPQTQPQPAPSAAAPSAGAPAPAPTADLPAAPANGASRPARVLYIEDNPVNAMLVGELLATRPAVALQVAEDGRSGLAAAAQQRPDLILIDLLLPDLHGMAVLEALKADPATAGVTCIALSANATDEDIRAARAAGFADYWTKPIDLGHFIAQLSQALGRPL